MNSGIPSNPERQNQSQPVSNAQQSPKLLTQVRNKMRVLHYSIRTESAYVDWIVRFRRVLRIRRCAPLSFSIDRCSNWIRVVWMEYGPRGRSGCPSCCHMRKFEGSLTLVRRAVWCDSSANCFTAPGCDCWKFAGCESKTSTFNADRFSFATARAKKIAWFLSPNDALNRAAADRENSNAAPERFRRWIWLRMAALCDCREVPCCGSGVSVAVRFSRRANQLRSSIRSPAQASCAREFRAETCPRCCAACAN